ncbi:hypothetical protein [Sediminibacterium ginsengisoli]|uniref:DUF4177 domain-containing protein n=1 Tax=Sediminibacterium ginsengisoli TaxID=413434 RepID=A0A1T4JPM9_9BACT|nr:hypothetical protein [Sediminibacterium ginsengisoli]SJZ32103.1 hypothetical protein SAMN04488132_10141 [Sediminibacterium ginsengisoli]
MKFILLFLFLTLYSTSAIKAQSDTTKVEQYCELVAQGRLLSNKVTIDVNFGEERKFFGGDTRLKDEVTGRLKKFNSVTDALNYLGLQGWTLVNAFPLSESSGPKVYHFYFKKLFNKADLIKANAD